MRTLMLYMILSVFLLSNCNAQNKLTLRYLGYQFNSTKNKSFVSQDLKFLKDDKDTIHMNVRLPFDTITYNIIDRGIFYGCHLKKDTVYTITLKKICVNNIPDVPNDYYKINTIPDQKDCSKFIEIEKNTKYKYEGNYGKYVDISGILFEIMGLNPSGGCFFQH